MDIREDTLQYRLAEATINRAEALWDLGEREQALEEFQQAYTGYPDLASLPYSRAVYKLGIEKREAGDLEGALKKFQSANELAIEGDWKDEIRRTIEAIEHILYPPETEPELNPKCPQCGKEVQPEWEYCPYCKMAMHDLAITQFTQCPNCGGLVQSDWLFCPKCSAAMKKQPGFSSSQVNAKIITEKVSEDNNNLNKRTFNLPSNPSSILELSWDSSWKTLTVRLDSDVIGVVSGIRDLLAEQKWKLSGGHVLSVRLIQGKLYSSNRQLYVSFDGEPMPGTPTTPEDMSYNDAKGCSFIIVVLSFIANLVFGIAALDFSKINYLLVLLVVEPAFLLFLAIKISRKSETSLFVFMIVYLLGGLLAGVMVILARNYILLITIIAFRILALAILFPGYEALTKLNLRSES
jgi:hypothetical protein